MKSLQKMEPKAEREKRARQSFARGCVTVTDRDKRLPRQVMDSRREFSINTEIAFRFQKLPQLATRHTGKLSLGTRA